MKQRTGAHIVNREKKINRNVNHEIDELAMQAYNQVRDEVTQTTGHKGSDADTSRGRLNP